MNWPEAVVISTAFICLTTAIVWVIKLWIVAQIEDEKDRNEK